MKENKSEERNLNISLKKIVKTSFFVFIGLILSKLFAYIYKLTIARSFGPEVYGLFSLAVMLAGFFALVSAFGLDSGLLRYVSFYRGKNEIEKIKYIYRITLKFMFYAGILSGIILFLLSGTISFEIFHEARLIIFLKWFSLLIPILAITGIFWSILKAYEEVEWYSFLVNILHNFLQIFFLIIFLMISFNEKSVIFSFNISYLITLIASFLICKKKFPEIFKKTNLNKESKNKTRKELFSYSWPTMFLAVILMIFFWTDSFVIGYLKSVREVGIYNAAVPIALLLGIAPMLFIHLLFPLITKEFSKNHKTIIRDLTKQVEKWIFILNLPLMILMVLFPGAIINLLFGPEYLSAEVSLRFLAIGVFFYSLFTISDNLLSMAGKSRVILVNIIITSIINLVLNILFIPKYGINGAAFSTMTSYIIWGFLALFQAKKYTGIVPLKRIMIKITMIIIIPTIILIITRKLIPINLFTIILQGFFFVLVYSILLLLTKSLDKNDFMILNAIKNKISLR